MYFSRQYYNLSTATCLIVVTVLAGCGGGGGGSADGVNESACSEDSACVSVLGPMITRYPGNKKAAASYTFDDGSEKSNIIVDVLDKYNIKATFYIIPDLISPLQWNFWRRTAAEGHEIGSHTSGHKYLSDTSLTVDQVKHEILDSKMSIASNVGIVPETFSFPGNAYNDYTLGEMRKYYLTARFPGYLDGPAYNVYGITEQTTALIMNYVLNKNIEEGSWVAFAGHSVDGDGYRPINSIELENNAKYAVSLKNDLWVDTFVNVYKYKICRESSKIVSLSYDAAGVTFMVKTDRADMCQFPLTVLIGGVNPQKNVDSLRVSSAGGLLVDVIPGLMYTIKINPD